MANYNKHRKLTPIKFGDKGKNAYFCNRQTLAITYMGKIIDKKTTRIVTLDGVEIIKIVTKVLMPNGKYRYPVEYYTVNNDIAELTTEQLNKIRIPVYKQLI